MIQMLPLRQSSLDVGRGAGATACNCTVCRRYGALWAYDYDGEGIKVAGNTRPCIRGEAIEFHDGRCVADHWF